MQDEVGRGEPPAKRVRYTDVTAPAADDNEELSLYGGGGVEQEVSDRSEPLISILCGRFQRGWRSRTDW